MLQFRVTFLAFACMLALAACSEPVGDTTCVNNSDCAVDHLCDPDGVCIRAKAISIKPRILPDALVGDGTYSQIIEAQDGIPPYSWSMEVKEEEAVFLDWLEIDAGELHAKDGRAPTQVASDLQITVFVLDSSNAGEGEQASLPFDLSIIECRGDVTCWEPDQDDACWEGVWACDDGILATECDLGAFSTDTANCGPDCAACPEGANRCSDGLCRCGASDPCPAGEACCDTGCFDLQTSQNHCGACDTDCDQMPYVSDPFCDAGSCNYAQCDQGNHDCDDVRENGCETPSDMNNCSACDDRCDNINVYIHTENHACIAATCTYDCLPDYESCDDNPANGCETPLTEPTTCGTCDNDCTDNPAGHACIANTCGCTNPALDCPPEYLCCNNACAPHDANHCGACDSGCSIGAGGVICVKVDAVTWECQCEDTVNHTDCKGEYIFSQASCRSDTHRCTCQGDENCAGTLADMCCITAGIHSCVDMLTDENNCGICGVICTAGDTCTDGACSCTGGTCPLDSGAPNCVAPNCVCFANEGDPCPPGQYCCTNKGCCPGACASTPAEECSNDCELDGNTWCWWGCCAGCQSEADCGSYGG